MGSRLRLFALSLFHLIQFYPSLLETEIALHVSKIVDNGLLFPLVGTCNVLDASVEGLLVGETGELLALLTGDQSFEVALLPPLDDCCRGEAEVSEF